MVSDEIHTRGNKVQPSSIGRESLRPSGGTTQILMTCSLISHTQSPLCSCPQTRPGCPRSLCRSGCSPHSELSSGWSHREIQWPHCRHAQNALRRFKSFKKNNSRSGWFHWGSASSSPHCGPLPGCVSGDPTGQRDRWGGCLLVSGSNPDFGRWDLNSPLERMSKPPHLRSWKLFMVASFSWTVLQTIND